MVYIYLSSLLLIVNNDVSIIVVAMSRATSGLVAARVADLGDARLAQCLIPSSEVERQEEIGMAVVLCIL
jgi:hypothetical protein